MAPRERGSIVRGFKILLFVLLFLGLAIAVGYLLSDINRRRYQLTTRGRTMVVLRGRFLPMGFESFTPNDDVLRAAYAPISLPNNEAAFQPRVFEDRSELDRDLFRLLAQWVRGRQDAHDPVTLQLVADYVDRAEILPGISEEQRQSLRILRADAAFLRAKSLLSGVRRQLEEARQAFVQAQIQEGHHNREAEDGLREVERQIQLLEDTQSPPL